MNAWPAFIGDAVSHAVFPGLASAFALQTSVLVGGAVAGAVVALLIHENGAMRLTDIYKTLDMPQSSTYRVLSKMKEAGIVDIGQPHCPVFMNEQGYARFAVV